MISLYARSLQIIQKGQSPSGAYVASPAFPTYGYCWLRDGSFIAHAMDTAGEYASADAFFRWADRTILKYRHKLESIRQKMMTGGPIGKDEVLHTRFTLDGEEVTTDNTWGNFQIDGYGTYLWALSEHARLSGNRQILDELYESILITLEYLEMVWKLPNYDCWEEYPDYLHTYSLAAVYGGVRSIADLAQKGWICKESGRLNEFSERVKDFIETYAVMEGQLVKHICPQAGSEPPHPTPLRSVDASLIGLSIPNNVFSLDNALIKSLIHRIETDLHRPGGGVYRYQADVYYGGGEWLILSAWLGWYYARIGDQERARALLGWIESQADPEGFLTEQVCEHPLSPKQYQPWVQKWGPVAKPLLWSHAMYIILTRAILESTAK
jgi:GH15 family glucan-1,4-alpha-glucosidase